MGSRLAQEMPWTLSDARPFNLRQPHSKDLRLQGVQQVENAQPEDMVKEKQVLRDQGSG